MSAIPPINYEWDGEVLRPLHPKIADKHLVIGERYALVEHQGRSQSSHNHYFAALHEGWQNLPEQLAERFATAEHLRAYALIKAGYHDSHSITCSSKAEAQRLAAFIRPTDEFSIVLVNEATVTRYTAQSQSMRAMGKQKFQESKSAVLEIVSEMVGIKLDELKREANRAA